MRDNADSGWRGVALVAVTYVYFLIFAQFAFLARLAELGIAAGSLKLIMAAMAAGGILFSLAAPRVAVLADPAVRLRIGFTGCALAALLTLSPLGVASAAAIAFLIGAALGVVTVTLVSNLRTWTGNQQPMVKVGLGTGLGYFVCNIPPFFAATPQTHAIVAGALSLAGAFITLSGSESTQSQSLHSQALRAPSLRLFSAARVGYDKPQTPFGFLRALACFTALVWFDSAAFFIIQHTQALKAGTWTGSTHLWSNAMLHLAAAILSGWLLQRGRVALVVGASVITLGFACILLQNPALVLPASVFYPIGVSLYSVALVAYPSFLTPAEDRAQRARQAGWIYAIAGWVGSALGIGMGQNLGHVPTGFVAAAGTVVLLPALFQLAQNRPRELALLSIVFAAAFVLYRFLPRASGPPELSAAERGRGVYISEGCISCHSQYVRPNSPDVLLWGPVESLSELHAQRPPLIGNRRQGPDLSEVGARRSPLWLKAHLVDPAQVSGGSIMPSFAFLFRDHRGDDLVAYLASLRSADLQQHLAAERAWRPAADAVAHANAAEGERIYHTQCATCHDADGSTRIRWQSEFKQLPANLFAGPFTYLSSTDSAAQRMLQLEQTAKFGIPGTDMPGHEVLNDREIASLTLWLMQHERQSAHNQ